MSKSLHDPEVMDLFLGHLRAGYTRDEALSIVGVPRAAGRKLIREDPVIYEQVREAERAVFSPVLKKAIEKATTEDEFGEIDTDAMKIVVDYMKHQETLDMKREEIRAKAAAAAAGNGKPAPVNIGILDPAVLGQLQENIQRRAAAIEAGEIIDAESEEA